MNRVAIRRLLAHELRALASLGYWLTGRTHGLRPGDQPFGYHRGNAVTMWLFLFGMVMEGVALEFLLRSPALLVLHVYMVVAGLGLIAAARTRPHVLSHDQLRLRSGGAFDLRVPRDLIVKATGGSRIHDSGLIKIQDERLFLIVDSRTNVTLELAEPVTVVRPLGRTGTVRSIQLFVDEPKEFLRALSVPPPLTRHGSGEKKKKKTEGRLLDILPSLKEGESHGHP